jgi:predicted restriction endonuclease
MVRQRGGQQIFRQAMLEYWGNACAVTGIALPEVLRASHAKPWSECLSDAERLEVFNGFLLSANLDALFDQFLITFSNEGNLLISSLLSEIVQKQLGLNAQMRMRWLPPKHYPYLQYYQNRIIAMQ